MKRTCILDGHWEEKSIHNKARIPNTSREVFMGERKWWWSFAWKSNVPLKAKILLWLVMENKILDLGQWTGERMK
jgi:hypothetical protein